MSPAFEAFLAQLYVDAAARQRFLADPQGEAARAHLSVEEAAALSRIDRTGLELAADSLAAKRRKAHPTRPSARSSLLDRVLARLFSR